MGKEQLRRIAFVLTDIDDTLTNDGRLPGIAYSALERLTEAGLRVIPVTGRPAGWCDLIARLWPVSAVIGENGAFYFARHPAGGMHRRFARPAHTRQEDRKRLDSLATTILSTVEGARLSTDQAFREADLAIDIAEDGPHLTKTAVRCIVNCFEAAGAMAKVSSIHVNGWFGNYDKLTMARRLFEEMYEINIDRENGRALFVGDSPNDAPMFGFFANSVGVANFAAFCDEVETPPKYMTLAAGGSGFAELAEAILEAREG
ncbi:HAD-IIB family hydrolase [Nitratireductor sp. GCM10026969]|uniref:HAD-IIB family hydrolase n=1 Tax=Nitratireductor sp. GCM10026969 TaxID=3252645 RepID=UPI003614117B